MADTSISAYPWLCNTMNSINSPNSDGFNRICSNESDTYDGAVTDAYDMYGLKCVYYRVSQNLNRDRLYGEDQLRYIERAWYFNGYIEQMPPNVRIYQLDGIWGDDSVKMFATIEAFKYYSTYGGVDKNTPEVYPVQEPSIGDIIYIPANDYFYEIRDIKYYENAFGLEKHTYTFTLKMYRDNKWTISADSPTISDHNDPIYRVAPSAIEDQYNYKSPFQINDDLTSAYQGKDPYNTDTEYKYTESIIDNPRYIDPFNGW